MASELSGNTLALYEMLRDKGDVHVLYLYEALRGRRIDDHVRAQRELSPDIARFNARMKRDRLLAAPGSLRYTYRLVPTTEA
jgi:hypothetical protein